MISKNNIIYLDDEDVKTHDLRNKFCHHLQAICDYW